MVESSFEETQLQIADHIERLAQAHAESRGPFLGPTLDLSSPAAKNLRADRDLGTADLPNPLESSLGHMERLLFAIDDQLLCLAHMLRKRPPSWFGHLAVVRAVIECMSRVWYLAEPGATSVEVARRFLNERLVELNQMSSSIDTVFAAMPEDAKDAARIHAGEQRSRIAAWAAQAGVPNPGGNLGDGRPGPTGLLVEIYSQSVDEVSFGVLGAWHYSQLSSASHGLPDGTSRYVVDSSSPDGHPHQMLTREDLIGSVEPVVTVHEAMVSRLAAFFRWPISQALRGEQFAIRLYVNRASGAVQGDEA